MFDTTALSELKCLFDTVIMKEFILCRKGFDLVQSCKHVAICLCFLQMQIFIFNIHNKAVYIDKIVVTLARILSVIGIGKPTRTLRYIKTLLIVQLSAD